MHIFVEHVLVPPKGERCQKANGGVKMYRYTVSNYNVAYEYRYSILFYVRVSGFVGLSGGPSGGGDVAPPPQPHLTPLGILHYDIYFTL